MAAGDARPPHLIATLWTSGCRHGDQWERDCLGPLERAGWRVLVRRVEPDEAVCPTFEFRGVTWTGYRGRAEFFARVDTHRQAARQPLATGFALPGGR